MVFASKLRYDGDWEDDKAHGRGVCFYPNGQRYDGEWQDDQRSGWGKLEVPVEGGVEVLAWESYEGEWSRNAMHGMGRYTFADGSYFQGEAYGPTLAPTSSSSGGSLTSFHSAPLSVSPSVRAGEYALGARKKGKFVSGDRALEYDGSWRGEDRDGFGSYYQKGAYRYLGEWRGDSRHGRGRCEFADGSTYDGEWREDKMHGEGKWEFGGEKYEGSFLGNERSGEGRCAFEDGSRYDGAWKGGLRHGLGKQLYCNGDSYEGGWSAGKREGKGACRYANGDVYQGEWRADLREGHGVCVFADGTKYRGEWAGDKWIQSSADPEHTSVTGPGLALAVAGSEASFAIRARDEDGNDRLCGGDAFAVSLEGPEEFTANVTDNEDGTYEVAYEPTKAGMYRLFVTIGDDELVAESPYQVEVVPGKPCPRRTVVAGSGLGGGKVGEKSSFTVEARDRHDNRCRGGKPDMDLKVTATSAKGILEVAVRANEDGTFVCTYTPAREGFYRLELSSSGAVVGSSPYSLRVRSGSVGPQDSSAKVPDVMAKWETIAQEEYAADGDADGWDSEPEERETAEEKYIREHPGVAVVDNLEDMWKVGRFQAEKKAYERREKQKRLRELRQKLEAKGFKREAAAPGAQDGA